MIKEKGIRKTDRLPAVCFLFLLFCNLRQFCEAFRIVDSQIGQHLAVYGNILLLQTCDKSRITHTVQAGSSVDTGDPQAAEFALAEFTSDVSITQATGNLLGRGTVLLGFCSEVALRQLHDLTAVFMGVDGPLNACHDCFPPCRLMSLFVRQQLVDCPGFRGIVNNTVIPQVTGALRGLQAYLMVGVHLLMLYNTGLGKGKALGSTTVGFLFRHFVVLLPMLFTPASLSRQHSPGPWLLSLPFSRQRTP